MENTSAEMPSRTSFFPEILEGEKGTERLLRLLELKEKIQQGEYKIDEDLLAQAFLDHEDNA